MVVLQHAPQYIALFSQSRVRSIISSRSLHAVNHATVPTRSPKGHSGPYLLPFAAHASYPSTNHTSFPLYISLVGCWLAHPILDLALALTISPRCPVANLNSARVSLPPAPWRADSGAPGRATNGISLLFDILPRVPVLAFQLATIDTPLTPIHPMSHNCSVAISFKTRLSSLAARLGKS